MRKVFKKLVQLTVLIAGFSICFIYSSAAVSSFNAARGVNMRVVDSSEALIALPNEINLNIGALETTTNYYKLELSDEKENKKLGSDDFVKINDKIYKKIFVEEKKEIKITDSSTNLSVKNNMDTDIYISSIKFNDSLFVADYDNSKIMLGETRKLPIEIFQNSNLDLKGIEEIEEKIAAELGIEWSTGSSTISIDINIGKEVEKEIKEVYTNLEQINKK